MTNVIDWLARAAAAGIVGALALGSPAADAARWDVAQGTSAQGTPAPGVTDAAPASPQVGTAEAAALADARLAEARIKDLHTKLQISAAEEPRFTALADVMRANARSMQALLEARAKDTDRTAVTALRWYSRLTEAHAAALKQFVPAFEALYTALSDSQRATADTIFQQFLQRPSPRKASQ